tara:strand:+ start:1000 stop:1152 length:153 start_codon:yes stop_codon:yes gene_type:complete
MIILSLFSLSLSLSTHIYYTIYYNIIIDLVETPMAFATDASGVGDTMNWK